MNRRPRLTKKQAKQLRRETIRAALTSGYVLTTYQHACIEHEPHLDLESLKQDLFNVRFLSIPIVRIRKNGRTLSKQASEELLQTVGFYEMEVYRFPSDCEPLE